MTTNAQKLLDNARADSPDRPTGCATLGRIIVTWDRIAKVYDVGTAARSYAKGPRRDVLPHVETMLARGMGHGGR